MAVGPMNPVQEYTYGIFAIDHIIYLIFHLLISAADDWLKHSLILEAFEARAIRMAASRAQNLANFSNPNEGDIILMEVSAINVFSLFYSKNYEQK